MPLQRWIESPRNSKTGQILKKNPERRKQGKIARRKKMAKEKEEIPVNI